MSNRRFDIAVIRGDGIGVEVADAAIAVARADGLAAVTLRGVADRVVVTTGTGRGGTNPRPPAYDPDATLVVLMGLRGLPRLVADLGRAGWPASLPVAVVERANQPGERRVFGTLDELPALVDAHRVRAPAVLVVGRVVAHAVVRDLALAASG